MTTLVIVESPGKLKKLRSILGNGYRVEASVGHVRDLPARSMGVAPPDYRPQYENTERGRGVLAKLAKAVREADDVLLASDPDREGESIAWHLADALHLKAPKRITFNAIEAGPVRAAVQHPRSIDMALVHAQEARRVLDRLVGYTVSPILSKMAGQKLSAGRVQSPAVRLVVDRERAIQAFRPVEHYTAVLTFDDAGTAWTAIWDTKPFLDKEHPYFTDRAFANKVAATRNVRVAKFEDGQSRSAPPAPFTTSTLQQSAQGALHFRPKLTMDLAQKLYEQGAISYHRTDTPNLSEDGYRLLVHWAQQAKVTLAPAQRHWKAKAGSQEAHEAIRPTHFEDAQAGETEEQRKLYQLIRNRTIASQLPDAVYAVRLVILESLQPVGRKPVSFIARGKTLVEPGWRILYGGKPPARREGEEDDGRDNPVPKLQVGASLVAKKGEVVTKTTKPPARFKQATLVKEMERLEIGRPSTYANILENITSREYIAEIKGGFLVPKPAGETIVDALVGKCSFIDLDYTKHLEGDLDEVASSKTQYLPVVTGAHQHLTTEVGQVTNVHVEGSPVAEHACPHCGAALRRIHGKHGFFWGCSGYPECNTTFPDKRGQPDTEHTKSARASTAFNCQACGSPLVHRTGTGKKGHYDFWGCSGFPHCKTTYQNGKDDHPVYTTKAAA